MLNKLREEQSTFYRENGSLFQKHLKSQRFKISKFRNLFDIEIISIQPNFTRNHRIRGGIMSVSVPSVLPEPCN